MRLDGKVALITGGARGQGAAAARRFVAEGAAVLITDVLDAEGTALAKELTASGTATYRTLDVGDEDAWAAVAQEAKSAYGRLDVLVNNAGILHISALAETTLAEYERVIRVNQIGTFLGMRAAVPLMRAAGGSIVNLSSIEGIGGMPYLIAYAASKFAIRGMTKVAAMELGRHGIRVNSVHPGAVDTAMVSAAMGGMTVELAPIAARVALGRVATADDVANLVLFLASDESSYCTGSEFVVDGGATASHTLAAVLDGRRP